jgi:outer membrane lipoprotein-sorting protein
MNERDQENNLRRLIAASLSNARPAPEIRQKALQDLRTQLRAAKEPGESRFAAGEVTFEPVSNRFQTAQNQNKSANRKDTIMNKLFTRWGFGLGAAAGAAAVVLILVLATPKEAQGKAVTVMARAAQAVARLTSVHYTGQLRTDPRDNFSFIAPDQNFVTVELWKQFGSDLKWRVDKPGRIAVMDGKSSLLFIKPDYALKGPPSKSAFDTQLFHELADISDTLTSELSAIKAHGWPVTLAQERSAEGKEKSVVTVHAKSGLPDSDYLKNKFFMTADTRRVYVFDNESELLESVKIYTTAPGGEQLVFELTQIDYNQAIDPAVFELQLPAGVTWDQGMKTVPDNAKYTAMTPEQAARAFFEACSREDWAEVEKFCTFANNDRFKQYLGGVEIVSLGQAFTSAANAAQFVPYELKLRGGELKKHNLALKKDPNTGRWFVDGGI